MPDSNGRFKGISVPELPWKPPTMAELNGKTQEEVAALLKQRVAVAFENRDAHEA